MKLVMITDTHMGIRNGSKPFMDYQMKKWKELFEFMKKEGIRNLIHGGDFFDNRSSITLPTLNAANEFNDLVAEYGIDIKMIVGNHDVAFKNDNSINSPEELINAYVVWENPVTAIFDGLSIDLIPWVNNLNFESTKEFISKSKSSFCIGHFEVNGAPFHKGGHVCEGGMDASLFERYEKVLSGHFHTRSKVGKVEYIGAGFDYTWADWNDKRGFVVIDTADHSVTYHDWDTFMFTMGEMNEEGEVTFHPHVESIEGLYVRVVVNCKTNKKIEKAITDLESQGAIELQIFFNDGETVNQSNVSINDVADETGVIKTVLEGAIEDKDFRHQVQTYLETIYREASVS